MDHITDTITQNNLLQDIKMSDSNTMYVTKRSGVKEEVSFDKIIKRLKKLSVGLSINIIELAQVIITKIYDGIKAAEIDELAAGTCASKVSINPDYGILASRIIISNHHKFTSNSFSEVIQQLRDNIDPVGNPSPIINDSLYNLVMANKDKINSVLDYDNDYKFDYFGFKTLERTYLLKVNERVIERPQHMFMRVCLSIHRDDIKEAIKSYREMSYGYFTHATPTLYNMGTQREQAASCFLVGMENDSIAGIYSTLAKCAEISKNAGGIGIHIHNIRAKGSYIRGTNGYSNGIVPMLQVFNKTAKYVDQGGQKRPGSIAIYLEPWHGDIEDFLMMRRNTGDPEERARDLFYALWIPDLFMERVQSDGQWTLMCPDKCPGLADVWGDKFKTLYERYEADGKGMKTVSARKLWETMIESQIETGMPYIGFKDAVNRKSNQQNLGTIKSSNLCVDGDTEIILDTGISKIKDVVNTAVNVWNGFEFSEVTIRQTGTNQVMDNITFSNGAELTCTPEHKFYIVENDSRLNKLNPLKNTTEIRAHQLEIGMKIMKFGFPVIDNNKNDFKYSYTHGLFCADGTYANESPIVKQCDYVKLEGRQYCKRHLFFEECNKYTHLITNTEKCNGVCGIKRPIISLYDNKIKLVEYMDIRDDCNAWKLANTNRITLSLPLDISDKYFVPYDYGLDTKLRWLEGFADGDGTVTNNAGTQSIQLSSIHIKFLQDVKRLINTLGIDCKITNMRLSDMRMLPDGKGCSKLYACKPQYRLIISSYNLQKLIKLGFNPKRLILIPKECNRESSTYVTVTGITRNYKTADTYCFTEPKRHLGVFNGIVTGQCIEVLEYSSPDEIAVCNLLSVCLPKFLEYPVIQEPIKIYTKSACKYCDMSKSLLTKHGYAYTEINLDDDIIRRDFFNKLNEVPAMAESSDDPANCIDGACKIKTSSGKISTVPQIFVGDQRIGTYNDLRAYMIPRFNYDKLREITKMAVRNLNKLIDYNYYPVPETRTSNMRHRPIGIGIQGIADVFALLRITFESAEAIEMSRKIAEHMYLGACQASMELAKKRKKHVQDYRRLLKKADRTAEETEQMEHLQYTYCIYPDEVEKLPMKLAGAYSSFVGSPASEGQLQFDLWGVEPSAELLPEWLSVKDDIKTHGLRNSLLMAMMPTATTAQIMGNNECFEPFTSNIYTRKTLAGSFPIINKYLVADLMAAGLWSTDMKDKIILNNGSVQAIHEIPENIRNLYKTVWEIKQKAILDHAIARGPYICQTQSMNLFFDNATLSKINSSHFYSWRAGLKTGIYYLRTKAKAQGQQFSVDINKSKSNVPPPPLAISVAEADDEAGCTSCSA